MHSYFQFLTLQVFCPIILERDVKTTDFDPTLSYLGQNILSKDHYIFAWGKKTNKMQQYRWFIVNYGCWLLTMSQHVSGIFMPIFRKKEQRVTAYEVYLLVMLDVAGWGAVVLHWGCDHCEGESIIFLFQCNMLHLSFLKIIIWGDDNRNTCSYYRQLTLFFLSLKRNTFSEEL